MEKQNFKRTRLSCFYTYLAMSSVFVLPPMLFVTFHQSYGVSFTLLGTLVLINFCTQMVIDLIFTFFSKLFNIKLTVRIMPLITALGLFLYALLPTIFPDCAYLGLVIGTIFFSLAAGLCEVLLSPLVAACPSANPEKDMSLLHSLYGWGVVSVVALSTIYFAIFGREHWNFLVFFFAIVAVSAAVLFWVSPIPDLNVTSENTPKTNKGKGLFLCAVCIFLGSATENTMTNWISTFMETALNIPKSVGDILGLAVFAFLLAITRVLYAKFTPNIAKTLLFSMIGAAICYLIVGLSPNVILSFIACILIGIFSSMLWPGTLIMMEEKIPSVGVAAYAMMAAGGDMGASFAPQLLGVVVDKVSVSSFALEFSASLGITAGEFAMKFAMLLSAIFPILGALIVVWIMKSIPKKKEDALPLKTE